MLSSNSLSAFSQQLTPSSLTINSARSAKRRRTLAGCKPATWQSANNVSSCKSRDAIIELFIRVQSPTDSHDPILQLCQERHTAAHSGRLISSGTRLQVGLSNGRHFFSQLLLRFTDRFKQLVERLNFVIACLYFRRYKIVMQYLFYIIWQDLNVILKYVLRLTGGRKYSGSINLCFI